MTVRQENVAVKTNVKVTLKYFSYEEFDSPDLPNSGFANMDRDFLSKLDRAREIAQIPFEINSGYRTDTHNEKVGGKLNSSHRFVRGRHCHSYFEGETRYTCSVARRWI